MMRKKKKQRVKDLKQNNDLSEEQIQKKSSFK